LAAASLVAVAVLMTQRPVNPRLPPASAAAVLSARLDSERGQHLFVAAYDPNRNAVMISSLVPAGTDPGHVHELWLIPVDGKPRALGFVPAGASVAISVSAQMAGLANSDAALAISVEQPGGSRKEGPTGPVVAVGNFTKI
jgi:anti-sigma-K factor RskA